MLYQSLILVVHVGTGPRRLPLYNGELHVLDLDPHKQKVDFAYNNIAQVIPA